MCARLSGFTLPQAGTDRVVHGIIASATSVTSPSFTVWTDRVKLQSQETSQAIISWAPLLIAVHG